MATPWNAIHIDVCHLLVGRNLVALSRPCVNVIVRAQTHELAPPMMSNDLAERRWAQVQEWTNGCRSYPFHATGAAGARGLEIPHGLLPSSRPHCGDRAGRAPGHGERDPVRYAIRRREIRDGAHDLADRGLARLPGDVRRHRVAGTGARDRRGGGIATECCFPLPSLEWGQSYGGTL